MRNKLRKITIENKIYLYTISDKYDNGNNTLTLKVFLTGHKAYPLTINFFTWSNKKTGDPLNVITTLINAKTQQNEHITIHRPKYVRELILQAIKQGWTEIKAEIFDGIDLLNAIGFEADTLRPYSNPKKKARCPLNILYYYSFRHPDLNINIFLLLRCNILV